MPTLQELQAEEENKRLAKATTQVSPSPILPTQAIPVPSSTPSTTPTMGIVPKAPVAQPEIPAIPTEKPLSQFNQATGGQDVQFRQTYRDSLGTVTPDGKSILKPDGTLVPNGNTAPVVPAPTTPTSPTGLSGAELQAYNQLSTIEQETYKKLATQGVKAQTDYLTKAKANMEFNKSQQDTKMKMQGNENTIYEIQSSEQLAKAKKSLGDLKQNIGYIGLGGQPGKSMAKMDAISNQVATAEKTYQNILEVDRLMKENRALGQEANVEIFSRQMKLLQDDLDGKVNKSIQGALNQFNSAELEGKLDTIPEIEAFQQQLYSKLDGDLSSIMDTNIEARKFLIERYDKLAESQKTQMANAEKAKQENEKRKNSINKEMSIAKGFYVNDNGEMIRDEVTGKAIPAREDAKFFTNSDTGEVSIMQPNRDGTYSVSIHKVMQGKPTEYKESTVNPGMVFDPSTGTYKSSTGAVSGDLRYLTSQYPGEAWAKNNNPAGISWNNNFDNGTGTAGLLNQAGVQYSKGTPRPEGGNYVTFNSIEDGLKAQQIMITQTYGNSTVGQMLSSWVGTSEGPNYAKQVAGMAGVDINTPVSQLSIEQLSTLQMAKIQKESPGLAKLLQGSTQPIKTQGNISDSLEAKVINIGQIAYGKNVSDSEGKRIESLIKKNPGASVQNIALAVRGMNVSEENRDTALQYVRITDKLKNQPDRYVANIADYVNRGDYKGLNEYVNSAIETDLKEKLPADTFIPFSKMQSAEKNITEIIKLVENNKDKIGAVDGRLTKLYKKFGQEKDIQKLQTLMTSTFATLRKNFAGSAVTADELKALQEYISGDISEQPENLIQKLKTVLDIQKTEFDGQRQMYGVPNVKTLEAKKKLGGFSLTDILSKLP